MDQAEWGMWKVSFMKLELLAPLGVKQKWKRSSFMVLWPQCSSLVEMERWLSLLEFHLQTKEGSPQEAWSLFPLAILGPLTSGNLSYRVATNSIKLRFETLHIWGRSSLHLVNMAQSSGNNKWRAQLVFGEDRGIQVHWKMSYGKS